LLAQVLVCMGWLYIRLGQLDEATRSFEESQDIYTRFSTELSPPPGIATDPLVGLSLLSNMRGEYDRAVSIAEQGREQNAARQDKHSLAFVYYVLTSAYMAQGDYTRALHSAEQAYQLVNEVQNSWFMAYVLNEWGNVARAMGRYAEARQRYLDSYDIRESFNDPEGMAVALSHLGRIAILERDYLAAKSFYQQSLSIYQNINDRGGLSTSLAGLGSAAAGLGELEKSGDYLCQALQTAWDIHHLPLTLATLIEIAELYLRSGLVERAIELLLFVRDDPASDHETRHRAAAIVEQNTSQLAGFQFAAAQKRVEAIQLDRMVEALLLELNISEKEM
jgi:tetratricopeptide (TPR) repeat protein